MTTSKRTRRKGGTKAGSPDVPIPLDELFRTVNESFTAAAAELEAASSTGALSELPFHYRMPRMMARFNLELTYSSSGLMALFKDRQTSVVSTQLEVELVAIPRKP